MTWLEWITLSNAKLKQWLLDPADRMRLWGHGRALKPCWAISVGMWGGVCTSKEIVDATKTTVPTYGAFKHHWRLVAAKRQRVDQYMLSQAAYDLIEWGLKAEQAPVGVLARRIWMTAGDGLELGIMPVEIVLRYHAFDRMLLHHGLARSWYDDFTPAEKRLAWSVANPQFPSTTE